MGDMYTDLYMGDMCTDRLYNILYVVCCSFVYTFLFVLSGPSVAAVVLPSSQHPASCHQAVLSDSEEIL